MPVEDQSQAAQGENAGAGSSEQGQQSGSQVIDWNKVDLASVPETLVKEHPAFKKVLGETIERRQQIKTLREQLEALEGEKPAQQQQVAKPDAANQSDLAAQLARLSQEMADIRNQTSQSLRADLVKSAIKRNNLPDEAIQKGKARTISNVKNPRRKTKKVTGTIVRPAVPSSSSVSVSRVETIAVPAQKFKQFLLSLIDIKDSAEKFGILIHKDLTVEVISS